jgi:hypothetical protein
MPLMKIGITIQPDLFVPKVAQYPPPILRFMVLKYYYFGS